MNGSGEDRKNASNVGVTDTKHGVVKKGTEQKTALAAVKRDIWLRNVNMDHSVHCAIKDGE